MVLNETVRGEVCGDFMVSEEAIACDLEHV